MQWQDMETAPKDGTQFLGLWWEDGYDEYLITNYRWEGRGFFIVVHTGYDNDGDELRPRMWMPIPELPQ
jgi:hypothetical protein